MTRQAKYEALGWGFVAAIGIAQTFLVGPKLAGIIALILWTAVIVARYWLKRRGWKNSN